MASKKNLNDSTLLQSTVSPKDALTFVRDYRYVRQRDIVPAHIRYLMWEMANHNFAGKIAHIMICQLPDGSRFTINGYHTCWAIVGHKAPVEVPVWLIPCETMADVDNLYAKTDRGKPRGAAALARAHGFDLGWGASVTTVYTAALKMIMRGFRRSATGNRSGSHLRDIAQLMKDEDIMLAVKEDWVTFMKTYFGMVETIPEVPNRQPFLNAGTTAIAMACLRYGGEFAHQFWSTVIRPTTVQNDAPEFALTNALRSLASGGRFGADRERTNIIAVYAAAIAWNARKAKQPLTSIKLPQAKALKRPLLLVDVVQYDGMSFHIPNVPGYNIEEELAMIDAIQLPDFDTLLGIQKAAKPAKTVTTGTPAEQVAAHG